MKTVIKKRGRKPVILNVIKSQARFFSKKTTAELVDMVLPQVQKDLKGGVNGDIKKQKNSLTIMIHNFRKKGIAEGKAYGFSGRMINGERKTAYVHKKAKVEA